MSAPNGYLPFPKDFATHAIHQDQDPDKWSSKSVVTPVHTSTTYKQSEPGNYKQFTYGRSGNPTRQVLENVLAKLENGNYGVTFSSCQGATSAVISLLKAGDHIIIDKDVYGGVYILFTHLGAKFNIEITMADLSDIKNLTNAIKTNTKLIWFETPSNPLLKVVDIKAAADVAKEYNIILAVDNSFLTSYLQRPLNFGADLVVYSLTKYMNGHSDVVMGAVITSNRELYDQIKFLQYYMGIVPSPVDCYQVLRSLKTLAIRMEKHVKNSLVVAKFLEAHPNVEKVLHTGLPSHPQYELCKRQTSGHSGVFSFYLKGDLEDSKAFLKSLRVFTISESFGGYESLAQLPCIMTHACITAERRKELGITDSLIRISVGLEDSEVLVSDLEQALERIKK